MAPQSLGPGVERGYYIVWDKVNWRKEQVCRCATCNALVEMFLTNSVMTERVHVELR